MRSFYYVALLFSVSLTSFGQEKTTFFKVGSDIPVSYSLGFDFPTTSGFSFNIQAGILTKPYDDVILTILNTLVDDDALTNTIGEAFSYGIVGKTGIKYHFKHFYTGINYSFMSLFAEDAPVDLINSYYNLSLPSVFLFREVHYKLRSNLNNIGILIGKDISISEGFLIGTDIGIQKTIYSRSDLFSSADQNMELASNAIDNKLGPIYIKYAWIPSVNFYLKFRLGGDN